MKGGHFLLSSVSLFSFPPKSAPRSARRSIKKNLFFFVVVFAVLVVLSIEHEEEVLLFPFPSLAVEFPELLPIAKKQISGGCGERISLCLVHEVRGTTLITQYHDCLAESLQLSPSVPLVGNFYFSFLELKHF